MTKQIAIKNISKKFGNKLALDDVSLTFEPGKVYGLLGPNASGKTTLIKLMNDLLNPSKGEITVDDKPLGAYSKSVISYLPDFFLMADQKIERMIKWHAYFFEDFNQEKCLSMLSQFEIDINEKSKTLSKGTVAKLGLALALSRSATYYILDEPLDGVDPASRDEILETILSNIEPDKALIICTHLIADIERILDQIIFLKDGKVILNESADDLRLKHHTSIDTLFRETFKK